MTEGVTGLRAVGLQEGAASARIKPLLPVLRPHGSGTQSYAESPHGSGTIKRPKRVVYDERDTHATCNLSVKKTILEIVRGKRSVQYSTYRIYMYSTLEYPLDIRQIRTPPLNYADVRRELTNREMTRMNPQSRVSRFGINSVSNHPKNGHHD